MKTDEVDAFTSMFLEPPGQRRQARQQRAKRERRTQLTDRQRDRAAVRTEQINFRCSREFKTLLRTMQDHLGKRDWSIANILEEALEDFAAKHGVRGE